MSSFLAVGVSRHVFPFGLDKDEREYLASLYAAYLDFHDVALALLEGYSIGTASFELVEAAFKANGWEWPNHG